AAARLALRGTAAFFTLAGGVDDGTGSPVGSDVISAEDVIMVGGSLESKLGERIRGPRRRLKWSVAAGGDDRSVLIGAARKRGAPDSKA
ncbi:hypothetical protein OOU_Y34scaffold00171g1, partial [Pyricularia oryzae Y34]